MLYPVLVIVGLGMAAAAMRGGLAAHDALCVALSTLIAGLLSARLGWLGREAAVLPRFLRHAGNTPRRLRAKADGAFRVARAAISADVTLKPALIKLALAGDDPVARAEAAAAVSQAPGAACVTLSDDAMLVHVLDEDASPEALLRRRAGLPRRKGPL